MKRLLLVLSVLVMLVCLAACSGDAPAATTPQPVETANVTFVWHGDSFSSVLPLGTVPTPPTPVGYEDEAKIYTFKGWDKTVTGVTGDVTYTAVYTSVPREYDVTFIYGGSTTGVPTKVAYGTVPTAPVDLNYQTADKVYTFSAWDKAIAPVSGDVTYTAVYTSAPREYDVTFIYGGNTTGTPIKLTYGTAPTAPTELNYQTVDKIYTFTGWDKTLAPVTGDVTYTAVYTSVAKEYTVSFAWEGGSSSAKVAYGETPSAPSVSGYQTVSEEYTFIGWDKAITPVSGDVTYTAAYVSSARKYDVVFTWHDGSFTGKIEYGNVPTAPIPTGYMDEAKVYSFAGWDKTVTGVTGDVSYTAVYTSVPRKYTVSFVWEGGSSSAEIAYGTLPIAPVDLGYQTIDKVYTFSAWDKTIAPVSGDVTYTAVYTSAPREYDVTFIYGGSATGVTTKVAYGTTPTAPVDLNYQTADKVYTFSAWDKTIAPVSGDVTYTAVYTSVPREYDVTFIYGGSATGVTTKVAYGTTPTAPVDLNYQTVDKVYTFSAWDKTIAPVSGDITYTAVYTSAPREYDVTFIWEGGSSTVKLAYGSLPTSPEIDGYRDATGRYIFAGWDKEIAPVTGNVTYTASYTGIWESIATDVKAMDESLRHLKFQMSDWVEGSTYQAKCEEMMAGPDSLEDASNTIDQLVYTRNRTAMDLLGIEINYVYTTEAWGQQAAIIQMQTDDASNPDAADLFVYTMYDMVVSCFNSSFRDLASIEGSYLDFESDGWYGSIMSDMSFDRTKIYVMASDYFSEIYRSFMVLPVNLTMVDSATNELGSILLPAGQTLRDGEYLSDYLFRMVQDGNWTWDVLTAMCQAIYIDNNCDGIADSGDRMGIYMDTYAQAMAIAALYSTKLQCLTDGVGTIGTALEGKLVPIYPATGDEINRVFLAIGRLMNANGSLTFASRNGSNVAWFAQGLSLTAGPVRIGELEEYASMSDDFAVVPLPLLDRGTAADYNTSINNYAALGGMNINSPRCLAMSAYIQLVTERSEDVKRAYLASVTGLDLDAESLAVETLELITSSCHTVREMILDYVLRARKSATIFNPEGLGDVRWNGLLKNNSYAMAKAAANGAFLDKYVAIVEAKQRGMNELMVEWYAPTEYSYTVIFSWHGDSLSATYLKGETPTAPTVPDYETTSRTYTFSHWDQGISAVSGDVTYTAVYTSVPREYDVTFIYGGSETGVTVKVAYGTTPTAPVDLNYQTTDKVYTFSAWDKKIATVRGDVIYTAVYTSAPREYDVTFVYDGKTESVKASYGSTVTLPIPNASYTKDSWTYIFAGAWDKTPTTITEDTTYTARYTLVQDFNKIDLNLIGEGYELSGETCTFDMQATTPTTGVYYKSVVDPANASNKYLAFGMDHGKGGINFNLTTRGDKGGLNSLGESMKMQLSFKLGKDPAAANGIETTLRLRGPGGSSDTFKIFSTTKDGDVSVFGTKITTLTTTMQTFVLTIDFKTGAYTVTVDGEEKINMTLTVAEHHSNPSATSATTVLDWAKTTTSYVFNWYMVAGSESDHRGMMIDDLSLASLG